MADDKENIGFKYQNPDMKVVSYVNSSANVKAVSDICCNSANATSVLNSSSFNDILFVPDKNLGAYVADPGVI